MTTSFPGIFPNVPTLGWRAPTSPPGRFSLALEAPRDEVGKAPNRMKDFRAIYRTDLFYAPKCLKWSVQNMILSGYSKL